MAEEILKLEVDYPLLCTRGAVLFPKNDMNIEAGRVFSKNAIKIAMNDFNNHIIVVPQLPNKSTKMQFLLMVQLQKLK